MNIAQIEANLQQLLANFHQDTASVFIYDLLLAYGTPKSSIVRLQQGGLNLSKNEGEIAWKKKLFYKTVAPEQDVHEVIERLKADDNTAKYDPRFIVVTDFETLLALDRKNADTLDVPLRELAKHFDFFLPWTGMEKATHQNENPADVKAAERMAKLYDEIKKDNPTDTAGQVHNLNVFLSRLLFCFFAEDTGIFEKGQFTNAIGSHTQPDGSDLHTYLDTLFEVMNTPRSNLTGFKNLQGLNNSLPAYLEAFPYVNGGLFRNRHHAPVFTRRSRQAIIDSGELDWAAINPDIFGSMIQAVITPEHRGGMGMHYTSVPNIMKVIEPLFLNDLYEAFEAAKGNLKKLNELLKRIWNIKIFDPACGSGNFLIIAYKELRKLEMLLFKEIDLVNKSYSTQFSGISLSNFYGIELDDFAHEVATLSLWLAEHQMNQAFFKEFGRAKPALPLKETGNIVHGNACRLDWEAVCPKKPEDEIYILGNPPYLGARVQDAKQKADLDFVFKGFAKYKDLDYIACWFYKGGLFIQNANAKFAFVSTNSICQGEQVALLWPIIFGLNVNIAFAHTSFKWTNNAKANAGVTVIIVGMAPNDRKGQKVLFTGTLSRKVENISPYLTVGRTIYAERRSIPLTNFPHMPKGNMPYDGGNLILSAEEKVRLVSEYPNTHVLLKRLVGSLEFINGIERWCLWIKNADLDFAYTIPQINHRLNEVKKVRLQSNDAGANKLASRPHQFREINETISHSIVIPSVSSETREYIPIGFIGNDTIITNLAFAIYEAPAWLFSVLTSRMHMTWVRAVCGSLETRIRYSSTLGYNTFPFPLISDNQKQELEKQVYRILDEREYHSEKTLAQLYDPEKMPAGLREAHRLNDLAVERMYRSRPFESDEERLEYLFKLYEQMIAEEQTRGTLFEAESKAKKKKK
ncbi:DNA methyltransferase [Runella sp.]|uniref:class I SAM-dependent DNA methyltransferase n=1 Tax=Runella sp. TaxID=1960881 RepID=UPI002620014A|nr:DNA methyltransferase [Runella sp.]